MTAFTFGRNWQDFSRQLDEDRVRSAERSLVDLLGRESLAGASLIDVGAGSGLFSIAALRLGAAFVVALDRDEDCVTVIRQNAQRLLDAESIERLRIVTGDVLRTDTLPPRTFDVVYAWGSLHHTGAMWTALANAAGLCRPGAQLAVAIYNRKWSSPGWLVCKRVYHAAPAPVRLAMVASLAGTRSAVRLLIGKAPARADRGMSIWYDAIDWLGGLPYECTSPEELRRFLEPRGFVLEQCRTTRRHGCNELVFRLAPAVSGAGTAQ
jgi:2-polyprenyl-6-hydroxyphenyl methylase/3-demethylubiquinone-9 3-methyltransferase